MGAGTTRVADVHRECPSAPSNRRYVEGQRIYLRACRPRDRASVVVDDDLADAHVVRRREDPPATR